MKFIICGCGRSGSIVASTLSKQNHLVTVVDKNKNAFNKLPNDFKGKQIIGDVINKNILIKADIKNADGLIAVTNGDNTNIIVSRIAKIVYNIDNIIARIYDPQRAEIYAKIGIPVVPSAVYAANEILRHILTTTSAYKYEDSTGQVVLNTFKYSDDWIGEKINKINNLIEFGNIAYINRNDNAIIPTTEMILQDSDELTFIYKKSDQNKIVKILKNKPKENE